MSDQKGEREPKPPENFKGTSAIRVELRIGQSTYFAERTMQTMELGATQEEVQPFLLRTGLSLLQEVVRAWLREHMQ